MPERSEKCSAYGFVLRMLHSIVCRRSMRRRATQRLEVTLQLVTLFSGTDGVLEVFEDIKAAASVLGIGVQIEYLYACDSGQEVKKYNLLRKLRPTQHLPGSGIT